MDDTFAGDISPHRRRVQSSSSSRRGRGPPGGAGASPSISPPSSSLASSINVHSTYVREHYGSDSPDALAGHRVSTSVGRGGGGGLTRGQLGDSVILAGRTPEDRIREKIRQSNMASSYSASSIARRLGAEEGGADPTTLGGSALRRFTEGSNEDDDDSDDGDGGRGDGRHAAEIQMLQDMGFGASAARIALDEADGDVGRAAELCLRRQEQEGRGSDAPDVGDGDDGNDDDGQLSRPGAFRVTSSDPYGPASPSSASSSVKSSQRDVVRQSVSAQERADRTMQKIRTNGGGLGSSFDDGSSSSIASSSMASSSKRIAVRDSVSKQELASSPSFPPSSAYYNNNSKRDDEDLPTCPLQPSVTTSSNGTATTNRSRSVVKREAYESGRDLGVGAVPVEGIGGSSANSASGGGVDDDLDFADYSAGGDSVGGLRVEGNGGPHPAESPMLHTGARGAANDDGYADAYTNEDEELAASVALVDAREAAAAAAAAHAAGADGMDGGPTSVAAVIGVEGRKDDDDDGAVCLFARRKCLLLAVLVVVVAIVAVVGAMAGTGAFNASGNDDGGAGADGAVEGNPPGTDNGGATPPAPGPVPTVPPGPRPTSAPTEYVDPECRQTTLSRREGSALDYYGKVVAIDGDTAVVGAEDRFDADEKLFKVAGSAYIFVRGADGDDGASSSGWTEQARLQSFENLKGDKFGRSVAIHGDIAVFGALCQARTLFEDDDFDVGCAYVFERAGTEWAQVAKLMAADEQESSLGFGVSVAVDGGSIMVGSDSSRFAVGVDSGSAYVFVRSEGGAWEQAQKIVPEDGKDGDRFGLSVALSGGTAVVGAYRSDAGGKDSGAAYVYAQSPSDGGNWSLQAKLAADDGGAGDAFARSVAVAGDTVVVGADSYDGNYYNSGAAYVFVRDGDGETASWSQQAKLLADDAQARDSFGRGVSVDGETAVVGSSGGAAYIFDRTSEVRGNDSIVSWTQRTKLLPTLHGANAGSSVSSDDKYGESVDLSGGTVVIGAYADDELQEESGSAYVMNLC